jgi:preprotein translocase subunit SecE
MSVGNYIKDTRAEMRHVNWPNRQQTINFTLIVIGLALFMGVYLGVFDLLFTKVLQTLIVK